MKSRVVDNHVVENYVRALVFLCHSTESIQEQAIAKLHDIGLVYACNFLHENDQPLNARTYTHPTIIRTFLPFLNAKSKANLAMRSAFALVDTFKLSTTPG